jgi:hypothetical protein
MFPLARLVTELCSRSSAELWFSARSPGRDSRRRLPAGRHIVATSTALRHGVRFPTPPTRIPKLARASPEPAVFSLGTLSCARCRVAR